VVVGVKGSGGLLDNVRETREHGTVEFLCHQCWVEDYLAIGSKGERELGGVEDLDRQAATDLHLANLERCVGT